MGIALLLDTHAFLWWMEDSPNLPLAARTAIADANNAIHVSAASIWEISTKHRLGKLPMAAEIAADLVAAVVNQGFVALPILPRHGHAAGALPGPHRDPFDRMLIAQAMLENLAIVSNEQAFDAYGVRRLW